MRANVITTSAATAVSLVLLAGCANTQNDGEPQDSPDNGGAQSGSEADSVIATVDTMFGAIEVPEPEDGELTVVALGWSDAEMALALDVVPAATFDWQGFGAENKGVGPWATAKFGEVDPEIIERGDETLNYEQLQALEPDLILNTRSGNDEDEFDRLSEIAPTIFGPEGAGAYATDWKDQLSIIGEAVGQPDRAQTVIEQTQAEIDEATQAHPEFEGLTVAAATKFGDAYGAYLAGDGRFDILADLGFVLDPAIEDPQSDGFFTDVSAENVSVLDADVAVVLPIGYTLEETQTDPLLASLDVISDDRAVFIDPDSELSGAYAASSVLSIPVVLDQLVPDLAQASARVTDDE
ncbi:MAG: iron-siderophore ABC transporter substrate-binding protein [Ornithinimicrobium sp.]